MGIEIESMRASDMGAICSLWRETEGIGDVPGERAFTAFLSRNAEFCKVAREDGVVIGALLASFDGVRGYFYRLAVKKEARRRKVAARLVEASSLALREAGADRLNLHVFDSNLQARSFWEKQGFKVFEGLSMMTRRGDGCTSC